MSGVSTHEVANGDAGVRLDRWFRRHFPNLSHGRLEKLLRTGQVRVDGKRARAGLRLVPGQV
ncbi:MAG: S4 domain-containing protein, partial [Alphaproteobacteria bacterium]